jgi:hypothetical protein
MYLGAGCYVPLLVVVKEASARVGEPRRRNVMTRKEIIAAVHAGKSLVQADLRGANLQDIDFQNADLSMASLQRVDLRGANTFIMRASGARTTDIELSWIPKKGDLVKLYAIDDIGGILLEDPDLDYIFDPVSVQTCDKIKKFSITYMKPASWLSLAEQKKLRKELKR